VIASKTARQRPTLARRAALLTSALLTAACLPSPLFAPISSVAFFDFVLATNAQSPLRSVADVLAAARAEPGGLNVGTINVGSSQNLSAELLKSTAAVDFTIVP
jgi:tripartite-type tricarboxylate transporter receptor subunit TctC